MAKEPDKIVWKATSLAAFTRSHRGSLVFRVHTNLFYHSYENNEKLQTIFSEIRMTWKVTPDDEEMYNRINGPSPFTIWFFGIPLPWSTWQENCSQTLDKKNCQILFYSPGEWGTTNRSIPPSKQLWIYHSREIILAPPTSQEGLAPSGPLTWTITCWASIVVLRSLYGDEASPSTLFNSCFAQAPFPY